MKKILVVMSVLVVLAILGLRSPGRAGKRQQPAHNCPCCGATRDGPGRPSRRQPCSGPERTADFTTVVKIAGINWLTGWSRVWSVGQGQQY
jgi:hypothetical protein